MDVSNVAAPIPCCVQSSMGLTHIHHAGGQCNRAGGQGGNFGSIARNGCAETRTAARNVATVATSNGKKLALTGEKAPSFVVSPETVACPFLSEKGQVQKY